MTPRLSVLALALAGAASPLAAQNPRVPPILQLPGGTRAMGLGGAFVAGDGPEAVFYNPAAAMTARGTTVAFHAAPGDATLGSLATGTTLLGVSLGMGMQFMEYRMRVAPLPGESPVFRPSDGASSLTAQVAGAIERKGIRVGVGAKYVQQHLANGRAALPALDIGASTNVYGVTVGIAATNGYGLDFGEATPRIHLPTRVTLGGSMLGQTLGTWVDANAFASVSAEDDGHFVPAGGVEVSYFPVSGWSLTGRAGMHGRSIHAFDRGALWNLGATVSADRLSVDYAFEPSWRGSGAGHRVGLRIR